MAKTNVVKATTFRPITLKFEDPKEFTDFFGALYAYARGKTKAGKGITEMGLRAFYSGNAREYARTLCTDIAKELGLPEPKFPNRRTPRGDEVPAEDYMDGEENVRSGD